jgi:hypothetical protein
MNKVLMAVMVVGLAGLAGGCASPGGMTYIGPVSYLHAKHSDKAMMMRSTAISSSIPAEKKEPVFKAVAMGAGPNEIATGVGVNVFALTAGEYTGGEVFMQFLSSLLDAGIYAGVGYGASEALSGGGNASGNTSYVITNNGNGNNNNINGGAGTQSNNSASDGAANGDVSVAP